MVAAFILSAIFLVSYVVSKLVLNHQNSIYEGEWRGLYLFILISHIILSIPVPASLLGPTPFPPSPMPNANPSELPKS